MCIKSETRGPVLWLTACAHGDEVGGAVVIQEVFRRIRKKKSLKKGSLFAFPMMNPIGLEAVSRLIPFSKEDLNRCFPGNPKGSLGERIAWLIFSTIMNTDPDLVVDLHNDWIRSIPYSLIEPETSRLDPETLDKVCFYARKAGFLVIRDSEHLLHTLSGTLQKSKVPAFTMELGESYVVNEKNILFGVQAIENLMVEMGLVEQQQEVFQYCLPGKEKKIHNIESPAGKTRPLRTEYPDPDSARKKRNPVFSKKNLHTPSVDIQDRQHIKMLTYSSRPHSGTSGIIRFMVKPGEVVKKGTRFARVENAFGKRVETLRTESDGIVLGLSDSSIAFPGFPVAAFGTW